MIPYFKWFPAEMEAETNFRCMTLEERGLFITCLNLAWVNNGLPSDLGELARMLRVNRNKLGRLWRGRVGLMFEQVGGRLRNTRQELDRQEVEYKSLTAAESANARWKRIATRIAPKTDSQCLRTDTDTDTEKKQNRTEAGADFYNDDWANRDFSQEEMRAAERANGYHAPPPPPRKQRLDDLGGDEYRVAMESLLGTGWVRIVVKKESELSPEEFIAWKRELNVRYQNAQAQKQA